MIQAPKVIKLFLEDRQTEPLGHPPNVLVQGGQIQMLGFGIFV
jgi:hypothetical protein